MDSRKDGPLYRCADAALVRAARYARLPLPAWPDLTDDTAARMLRWQTWLRDIWSLPEAADSIEQASPCSRSRSRPCARRPAPSPVSSAAQWCQLCGTCCG